MLHSLAGFLDLLAPPSCAGCSLPTEHHGPAFCDACAPLLEPAPPPLDPPSRCAAAFRYEGPLADAVRRMKYGGQPHLARGLGDLLAEAAGPYAGKVDRVVPVPLHRSKLRARGWNPAALLARRVARELGVPLDTKHLRRVRATRTQAALPAELRAGNVLGAFEARLPAPAQRVLLIDDVRTTGATLQEAASTLTERGHDVITLALAWAPD